jgi:hypothetical protein
VCDELFAALVVSGFTGNGIADHYSLDQPATLSDASLGSDDVSLGG